MLARIRKAMEEREGGFTLIELLVVIIIIGILAAIAIPVFLNQRKKGYEASMKSDLRTVANEMETYFTDFQTYAGAVSGSLVGAQQSVGSDKVSLSSGNTITVKSADQDGFCLDASSSKATSAHWKYDSQSGGIASGQCT